MGRMIEPRTFSTSYVCAQCGHYVHLESARQATEHAAERKHQVHVTIRQVISRRTLTS